MPSVVPAGYLKLWKAFKERNPSSKTARADHVAKLKKQRSTYLKRAGTASMSLSDWAERRVNTVKVCKFGKGQDGARVKHSCRRLKRCGPGAARNGKTARCNKCSGEACSGNKACRRRCKI